MRKYLFCFGLIASVLCCYGQGKLSFKFRKTTADFGTIDRKATKQIIVNFEFNNPGTVPLVILKAVPMCGCMKTEITAAPIGTGQKGIVKVIVDPKSQKGEFNKAVIVKTSASAEPIMCRSVGIVN